MWGHATDIIGSVPPPSLPPFPIHALLGWEALLLLHILVAREGDIDSEYRRRWASSDASKCNARAGEGDAVTVDDSVLCTKGEGQKTEKASCE